MSFFKKIAVLSVLSLAVGIAQADEGVGVIDSIDHKASALVIDDHYMRFSLNLKVDNSRGERVNRYALKVGQRVYYQFSGGDQMWEVSRIVINPQNELNENNED